MPDVLLITTTLKGQALDQVALSKDVVQIGRDENCDIVIENAGVSRQHAEIRKSGEGFLLVDLGSSNGTLLNGRQVESEKLSAGDSIQIGKSLLHVRVVTEEELKGLKKEKGAHWGRDVTVKAPVEPEIT